MKNAFSVCYIWSDMGVVNAVAGPGPDPIMLCSQNITFPDRGPDRDLKRLRIDSDASRISVYPVIVKLVVARMFVLKPPF